MEIILAEAMGMCFGVRDALAAMRRVERPVDVTVMGELVHNPRVMSEVEARGFHVAAEGEADGGATDTMLITAHGVSDRVRDKWRAAGKRVIDTTCPLVRRAHATAMDLAREGRFVVLCGRRGHVEVRGLTGDLREGEFAVIERAAEVRDFGWRRIGVMAQTTAVEEEVAAIAARVREKNAGSDVRVINTVCSPTRDRQAALLRLVEQVDTVIVVGGRHSNNTKRLAETARRLGAKRGVRVAEVEGAGDLALLRFGMDERIGITAGTSTLEETVTEVVAQFRKHDELNVEHA